MLVQVFLGTDRIFSRTHLGGHLAGSAVQGQTLLSKEPAFLPETSPPPTPPPAETGAALGTGGGRGQRGGRLTGLRSTWGPPHALTATPDRLQSHLGTLCESHIRKDRTRPTHVAGAKGPTARVMPRAEPQGKVLV